MEIQTPPLVPERRPETGRRVLFAERPWEFVETMTGFQGGPSSRRHWKHVALSLAACAMDSLLVVGGLLLLLASAALVLHLPVRNLAIFWGAPLWIAVGAITLYQVTLRLFLGQTLGEWACGIRLAWRTPSGHLSPAQQNAGRVLLRCLWIVATGLVILPVLSLILGRDLAGQLSGLILISAD